MAVGITAAELRTSTEEELATKLREAKEELFNLRFQAATGQLESHGRLHGVRREIARIYTVMRERELGIVTVEEPEAERAGAEEEAAPARSTSRRARTARETPADRAAANETAAEETAAGETGAGETAAGETAADAKAADETADRTGPEEAGARVAEEPDGDE
jgi:large subunit ribosomal protein L29